MNLDEFLEVSTVLTGVSEQALPADARQQTPDGRSTTLGTIYLDRLQASYPAELGALATAWREVQGTADPAAALGARLARSEAAELRKAARNDRVSVQSPVNETGFDNLVAVNGQSVRLIEPPENLVFIE